MLRALAVTGAVAACGPSSVDEVATALPPENATEGVVIEFEGILDREAGSFELQQAYASTSRGLRSIPVSYDGVTGSGPPGTVELVTEFSGEGEQACGFPSSFCGAVTVRSFFSDILTNTFVRINLVRPAAGHAPLNSDPAQLGLDNKLGLWRYGTLNPNGGAATRLWVFQSDGTRFTIRGEVHADIVSGVGCSDGSREGFVQNGDFPHIAGCSGGWSVPGIRTSTPPDCSRAAGDDSANPSGTGCNVADLCAPGWHVCSNAADVALRSPTGCEGSTQSNDPLMFFATRQGASGSGTLSCDGIGNNNLIGCGNHGTAGSLRTNCAPLDRQSGNLCSSTSRPPWSCGSNATNEALNVTKTSAANGGVLCCLDVDLPTGLGAIAP